jgi:hypothetical protein
MDYPSRRFGRNCDFPPGDVEGSENSFNRKRRMTLQQFTHVALSGSMLTANVRRGARRKQAGQTMPSIRK